MDLLTFANRHKTWIVLDGGDHEALSDMWGFLCDERNPYPFSRFCEPGLNNAITSLSIVLPERMYDDVATTFGKALVREDFDAREWTSFVDDAAFLEVIERKYSDWEREFLKRKAVCRLAD